MTKHLYDIATAPTGVGQITDLFWSNCSPDFWVYIGAVGWGSLDAFMSLVEPSWKEWVRWGDSNSFSVKWSGVEGDGRSWLHGGRWLMEGSEHVLPSAAQKGVQWIFDLGELVDIAAFWFFVGELAGDALIKSGSMIMQMSPCFKPPQYHAFFSKTDIGILEPTHDWQPVGAWRGSDQDGNFAQLGSIINVAAGETMEIAYQLEYANAVSGVPVALNTRVIDLLTQKVYAQSDWNPETADGKNSAIAHIRPFNADRAYEFQVQAQIVGAVPLFPWSTNHGHMGVQWYTPGT